MERKMNGARWRVFLSHANTQKQGAEHSAHFFFIACMLPVLIPVSTLSDSKCLTGVKFSEKYPAKAIDFTFSSLHFA